VVGLEPRVKNHDDFKCRVEEVVILPFFGKYISRRRNEVQD